MESSGTATNLVPTLSWDDSRLLIESVVDYAIFMLEPSGIVATWNRGAARINGYSAEEIVGQHFSVFFTPEDAASGKPEKELALARNNGRGEDEGWRVRKDGTRFWCNVVITALYDEAGRLRGYGKVTRDLTARREAEAQLRRAEERTRLLVESVTDYAIYMLDTEGRVTTWNAGAQRLKGYRASEVIGRSFSLFFPEEDVLAGKPALELARARDEGRFEEEGWRLRKDGSRFWASVIVNAIRDDGGALLGFAKVTRDLTAKHEAEAIELRLVEERAARAAAERAEGRLRESEERAKNAARAAEEANRIKDEFLATVSHELRTPLNAIVGWASMLHGRTLDASTAKAIAVIHRNALAQAKIIEDILDLSRIATGKLRVEVKAMDLAAITRDAIEAVRPSAAAKRLNLELRSPESVRFHGDAERLQQVVWNLISNAVKSTPAHGLVRVSLSEEDSKVTLTVEDNGKGMEPSFLPWAFERFQQADPRSTRRVGGLGLGLSLVRHLVELHGGTVSVSSAGLGQGASFSVTLPNGEARSVVHDQAPSVRVASESASSGSQLKGLRILVVEDDADTRELLITVLMEAGANVMAGASAPEAIRVLSSFRPELIVSDIAMPDEDGYQLMQRIRALDDPRIANVPAIALTAYARAADRDKATAAGFSRHVSKPVTPATLVNTIVELFPSLSGR
jgi:PAS domain S-box-containing protein